MTAGVAHRPLPVLTIAALLLRARANAGRAVVDLLAIAAFAVSTGLLLSVVAGARAFFLREQTPPQAFLDLVGLPAAAAGDQLALWTFLAGGAAVLLVVPLLTLSSAAARMGALGRDQRLAALRLLGVSSFGAVALSATETMAAAAIGSVAGAALYAGLLPVWQVLSFQAAPLSVAEMVLPWQWIIALLALVVVLAGVAAVLGLRQVRISPLGVARRVRRRGLRWQRLLTVPLVVVGWVAVAPLLDFDRARTAAMAITFVVLAGFMWVTNLVGPLLLQLAGQVMVRRDSPAVLLAGRRLLADPRGAWRNVAGLALAAFAGGTMLALPSFGATPDPLTALIDADLRTGTLLTLAIGFLVAAASTALNQAAAVLDRRASLVHLDHAGTPRDLVHRSRRHEVLVPTLLASVGAAGLSVVFFCTLGAMLPNLPGLLPLAAVLVAGVAAVTMAADGCRPLVAGMLAGAGPRAE